MINNYINQGHRLLLRYAQSHPKSMTMGMIGGTTLVGVVLFQIIDDDNIDDYKRDPKTKMGIEEARLIAMLENAKESTWQQNIQNAVEAQEKFMLPGRSNNQDNNNQDKFIKQIDQRSQEILENQHKAIDLERNRKVTTKFWRND